MEPSRFHQKFTQHKRTMSLHRGQENEQLEKDPDFGTAFFSLSDAQFFRGNLAFSSSFLRSSI